MSYWEKCSREKCLRENCPREKWLLGRNVLHSFLTPPPLEEILMSICCIILSHTVIHTGDQEGTKGEGEVSGIPLRTVPNHDEDDDVCAALG